MKKIISAIAATLLISAFVGCTAADDSTISSPRLSSNIDKNSGNDNNNNSNSSKNAIDEYCSSYTKLGSEGNETAYQCSNGDYYVCTASSCEEIDIDDYME